jgi:sorting nexin-1/2
VLWFVSRNALARSVLRLPGAALFPFSFGSRHHILFNVREIFAYTSASLQTSHSGFSQSEFTVTRRYSDFESLRSRLASKFRGIIVPPVPEKATINRFQKEFVTYRRKELERFLKRVVSNKAFVDTEDVKSFFDPNIKDLKAAPTATTAPSGDAKDEKKGGFSGFMSFISDKVTTVQAAIGKAEEVDPWFEQQKVYMQSLENSLHQLLNRSGIVTKKGRELNQAWTDFAASSAALAQVEADHDKILNIFYSKLTEVANQISALEKELAENEVEYFEDSMRDYIRIISSAKDVLSNRTHDLFLYQSATKNREARADKLEKSRGTPKESQFADELRDSEGKEKQARDAFDSITSSATEELKVFAQHKNRELGQSVRRFVQANMNHHLRVVDLWKELLTVIEDNEDKQNL